MTPAMNCNSASTPRSSSVVAELMATSQSTPVPSATAAARSRSGSLSPFTFQLLGQPHERARRGHACGIPGGFPRQLRDFFIREPDLHARDDEIAVRGRQSAERGLIAIALLFA